MPEHEDPAVETLLARTRRQWSPSDRDVARVRGGLGAALASGRTASAAGSPAPGAPRFGATPGWISRVVVTAAFTAAGAGVGYWAGGRTAKQAPPVAELAQVSPARAPALEAKPTEGPVPAPVAAPTRVATPASSRAAAARRNDLRRTTTSEPATAEGSLAEEVRALRNVERALREGNPGLASAFLDELDRGVPGGRMTEERDALRAIARCEAGRQPFGVNLAEDFVRAHPGSAYGRRVRDACERTDSPPTGDSAARR